MYLTIIWLKLYKHIYKLADIGVSSNLIGSLSVTWTMFTFRDAANLRNETMVGERRPSLHIW